MSTQQLPLFPSGMFDLIRANEGPAYVRALEQKIEKLQRSVAAYKGHFTKQQKKKQQHENIKINPKGSSI